MNLSNDACVIPVITIGVLLTVDVVALVPESLFKGDCICVFLLNLGINIHVVTIGTGTGLVNKKGIILFEILFSHKYMLICVFTYSKHILKKLVCPLKSK